MTKYGNWVPDPPKIEIFEIFFQKAKGLTSSFSECPQPLSDDNFKARYIEKRVKALGLPLAIYIVSKSITIFNCTSRFNSSIDLMR